VPWTPQLPPVFPLDDPLDDPLDPGRHSSALLGLTSRYKGPSLWKLGYLGLLHRSTEVPSQRNDCIAYLVLRSTILYIYISILLPQSPRASIISHLDHQNSNLILPVNGVLDLHCLSQPCRSFHIAINHQQSSIFNLVSTTPRHSSRRFLPIHKIATAQRGARTSSISITMMPVMISLPPCPGPPPSRPLPPVPKQ
jgi:hypothetical protein